MIRDSMDQYATARGLETAWCCQMGTHIFLKDLKISELKHQDIGQMQMDVNYYDRKVKLDDKIIQLELFYAKIKSNPL